MIAPASTLERGILDLWKRVRPDDAFAYGIEECAGHVFVPTEANVRRAVRRIDSLTARTRDPTARKFLRAMRKKLLLPEPAAVPEGLVGAYFTHMVKEGVDPAHARDLAIDGKKALDADLRRWRSKRWPPGMRALVVLACQGLGEVLDIVAREARGTAAENAVDDLRASLAAYRSFFDLRGFRPEGTFDEIFDALRRTGAELGRSRGYARALRDLWDYRESPREVEAAGLRMLRRELPRFRRVVEDLAAELGCASTAEAVGDALHRARGLRRDEILPFLTGLRDATRPVAHKHFVDINPDYAMEIVETPAYLANMTPSGAAFSLDTLTDHSREIFLATTDERSAGRPAPAELLDLLVHEEYGHCVHGSNSTRGYRAATGLLDVLNGPSVCVSEGLAFQMEIDFLPILQDVAAGKLRGPEESAFVEFLRAWGGADRIAKDYEFDALRARIVRFLRVVGDARINSGRQDLVAFVDWAHRRTGLERSTIYYNLFPAHQVLGPGYASTYAIIGERIRELRATALRRGKTLRDFYGVATSLGWPAKSVFESKLESWVRS